MVAPGPEVAMHTPTRPVATAYPSAACPAPLLVADEDVAHLRRVHQRVVCREDGPTRQAEDGVDADRLQGLDQRLGPGASLGDDRCGGHGRRTRARPTLGGEVGRGRLGGRLAVGHGGHHFFVASDGCSVPV